MSLPDATIELKLPEGHSENLTEGESVMLNVNAFKALDGVHIRMGTAKVDSLPSVKFSGCPSGNLSSIVASGKLISTEYA